MSKQRSNYTAEELEVFKQRTIDFIQKHPDANRSRISRYAGVGISVLEKLEKTGAFKLPKPMNPKQVRKTHDWGNMLGSLK
jgi:predicted protein tyrosine phosphatase